MGQRAAAAAFWPSAVGASCRAFYVVLRHDGVADHSMELYLDRLAGERHRNVQSLLVVAVHEVNSSGCATA